jgi:TP901-1 family phage major tail protein
MAESIGRSLTVSIGTSPAVAIARVQNKSMSVNRSPVDITTDDASGWRTLLADAGLTEVNVSVDGVAYDNILKAAAFDVDRPLDTVTLTWDDGSTLVGSFFIASYEETGAHEDSVKFTAEFQSSGVITFTAASV